MVGLDVFGYRSLKAIQEIPGLEYYHIDMKKGGEFMRAERKAELRQAADRDWETSVSKYI